MSKPPIDVSRHRASRRAVKSVLQRQRIFTVSKRFHKGGVTTRILVGGKYYDVDNRQLDLPEMGRSPAQLFLDPVAEK